MPWRNIISSALRPFDSTPRSMEAPTALVLVAFIALLAFQSYALYLQQPFDPSGFGTAVGLALGGGGVASYGQGYMIRSRTMSGTAHVDDPDAGEAL